MYYYVREQAVLGTRGGTQILGDQNGNDERVDGNDTGHDHRDQTLMRSGQK